MRQLEKSVKNGGPLPPLEFRGSRFTDEEVVDLMLELATGPATREELDEMKAGVTELPVRRLRPDELQKLGGEEPNAAPSS